MLLSHHNIMSNIESLRMVFRVDAEDNICSARLFFHSFGFTGTIWFPLLSGFSAAYHRVTRVGAACRECFCQLVPAKGFATRRSLLHNVPTRGTRMLAVSD